MVSPALTWLKTLGDASYSIYLGHVLLLGALRFAYKTSGLAVATAGDAWVFMAAALGTSALGGWVLYRFVETPLAHRVATWTKH